MIDKLEYVVALAREQHFGRAAEACGVSQPTLSAGLKSLEDALGVRIVNRSSRFGGFTAEGLRVLDWARRIVGDAKAMRQDLLAPRAGLSGHLRLAVIPTALPIVARLTAGLAGRHPGLRFSVLSSPSGAILDALLNLTADAGVSYLDNEPLGAVRAVPLYREGYRLLLRRDNPLALRATVSWAEVAGENLCLLTPDMQNRRIVDERLRAAGRVLQPSVEANSTLVLVSHVRTGRWATVLPQLLADVLAPDGALAAVPIGEPSVTHGVGLIVPRREPSTHPVAELVAEARTLGETLATSPEKAGR